MVHRHRCLMPHVLSTNLYSSMFFRSCMTSGHIFYCAPADVIRQLVARLGEKIYLTSDGEQWKPREVLGQGALNRLIAYEKMCDRSRRGLQTCALHTFYVESGRRWRCCPSSFVRSG
jgi:hypothetical protein